MRIMIGVGHPKHVHIRKNIINNLVKKGHEVKIIAWEKDITLYLLDAYGFDYEVVGKNYNGLMKKAYGMLKSDIKSFKIAKEFKPDILAWGGLYLAHVSKLIRKPHIGFTDTEHASIANWLSFPFSDVICTPSCYNGKVNPKKHVMYNGYEELAYLHPNYFKQDSSVLDDFGLSKDDKFIILRFVSWESSHDIGEKGFDLDTKRQFIKEMENHGRIFITSEAKLGREFEKYRINTPAYKIHSLLYFATMYIGESPTMTTESAILGTPAICVSSWACSCGNFEDLHNNYELIHCFKDQNNAITFALELLEDNDLKKKWQRKREKLLNEKIDVTKFMTDFIERYPESYHEYKKREG